MLKVYGAEVRTDIGIVHLREFTISETVVPSQFTKSLPLKIRYLLSYRNTIASNW